jgi:hypothetical protein
MMLLDWCEFVTTALDRRSRKIIHQHHFADVRAQRQTRANTVASSGGEVMENVGKAPWKFRMSVPARIERTFTAAGMQLGNVAIPMFSGSLGWCTDGAAYLACSRPAATPLFPCVRGNSCAWTNIKS